MSEPETPAGGPPADTSGPQSTMPPGAAITAPGATVVTPAIAPDRIVGGRYRLGTRRGIGLDIAIFEATDLHTERTVAVKIIHPDICAAPGFAAEFSTVIEQVMQARHPNLVEVLGAGSASWNGHPVQYVVCENLTGGSLRDLRDRRRQLSPSQAVMIGLDVCRGLDVAHRAGLVHGDLRPGNLVFGDDGRLRIADLGLAALVAGDRTEHPASMSIDRARYASPEQATGQPVGQASDIYSLCLCLVEGVTGVLPFAGDSTVATLANRVDRLMPVSADLGPLASVLERAGRPLPADRSTAGEFGRALVQAAEKMPRPAPIALLASGLFAEAAMPDPSSNVMVRPVEAAGLDDDSSQATLPVEPSAAASVVAAPGAAPGEPVAPSVAGGSGGGVVHHVVVGNVEVGESPESPPAPEHPTVELTRATVVPPPPQPVAAAPLLRERTSRRKLLALVAVLLVAAALGGALAWAAARDTSHPVPDLVASAEGEALNMISEFGWQVAVAREASDDVAVGIVIRTDPVAGAKLDSGDAFLLVVSSGPAPRVLPELVGLSAEQAAAALAQLGLTLQLRDQPFSEDVPTGVIVSWSVPDQPSLAAGDTVLPGTVVVVSISAGPEPRVVPDFTGFSLIDATAQLQALGLVVVPAADEFSDLAVGAVVRQDPAPGTPVARGAGVTLVISKGLDLVAIPPLAELNLQQAADALAAVGLAVGTVSGEPAGVVVLAEANGVALAANATLVRGTPIDLTLAVAVAPSATIV